MKLYAANRNDAGRIAAAAIVSVVTITNVSGSSTMYEIEFDAACVFSDQELAKIVAPSPMTIQFAADIVYHTMPTNSDLFDRAREILRLASISGYKFTTKGKVISPSHV